jgi:hypothetical protein
MVAYKKIGMCLHNLKSEEEAINCFKKQLELAW